MVLPIPCNEIPGPECWLVCSADLTSESETVSSFQCLRDACWCNDVTDIRKHWYQQNFRALIFISDGKEKGLSELITRMSMVLPEAPVLLLTSDQDITPDIIRLGVQDVWPLSELTDTSLKRLVDHAVLRKESESRSRMLLHYDALTGVANRSLFQDRLDHSLKHARRENRIAGLLCIDLDRFRSINEHYGHDVGDQLLKAFAKRLGDIVRRTDTVARLSGNNFAVILETVANEPVVTSVADKLCSAFSAPCFVGKHEIFCSISVGVEMAHKSGFDSVKMMRNAELAMRQAKQNGGNQYHCFSAELNPPDQIRGSLESALYHALEREELSLQYQPQVRVDTGDFIGTEALLRWHHSALGQIPPAVFIPALEETGLIHKVGEWVLSTACHQHQKWIRQGAIPADAGLSVNLSPRQFRQRDLADRIEQILEMSELSPDNLTLEITEGVLMDNLEEGINTLGRLRETGVSVAIDDFGTGYSSLAYLKDLPIDYLKIDRRFVKDIVDDADDAAIADSIIVLAHHLGLEVIAEGVEDMEVLSILKEFGCDHYQGFFFSRPVDAEQLPLLVQQSF